MHRKLSLLTAMLLYAIINIHSYLLNIVFIRIILRFKYLYLYRLLVIQLYTYIDKDTHAQRSICCLCLYDMYNDYLVDYIIKDYKTFVFRNLYLYRLLVIQLYTYIDKDTHAQRSICACAYMICIMII